MNTSKVLLKEYWKKEVKIFSLIIDSLLIQSHPEIVVRNAVNLCLHTHFFHAYSLGKWTIKVHHMQGTNFLLIFR